MISEIQIENFKSIASLSLKPGSITVLIGENGSGKSNILEAIAFAAAAASNKLDDEFLFNRGIRVTEKDLIVSAFPGKSAFHPLTRSINPKPVCLNLAGTSSDHPLGMKIYPPGIRAKAHENDWRIEFDLPETEFNLPQSPDEIRSEMEIMHRVLVNSMPDDKAWELARDITARRLASARNKKRAADISAAISLQDFIIYAPENSVLRNFETEGAIKPLGTKGEGLLKLLSDTAATGNGKFASELKSHLSLLGWFQELELPNEEDEFKGRLRISDRWVSPYGKFLDQRSANEGFLYLLFYFTLFLSRHTPSFFAIDNIDNSLNPKLCAELTRQLALLAVKSRKQVICTTHNPAVLDGLNLHDDKQRLYVVRRDSEGRTVVNRVAPPRPRAGGAPVRLSEAFMSGLLGGLPDHF